METTSSNLTSYSAELTDPAAAKAVIDRFAGAAAFCSISEPDRTGVVRLTITGKSWPHLVNYRKRNLSPDIPHEKQLALAILRVPRFEHSVQAFAEFLADLGPCLRTPLTVQAVQFEYKSFPMWACEWHVEAGTTYVQVNHLRHTSPVTERLAATGHI
jgi:hypothetical protein